jgi:tRNA(Arg) A34 adenosine deaminase TadA
MRQWRRVREAITPLVRYSVDGKVVETARNRVVTDGDVTAHAELTLVRKLER